MFFLMWGVFRDTLKVYSKLFLEIMQTLFLHLILYALCFIRKKMVMGKLMTKKVRTKMLEKLEFNFLINLK